VRLNIHWLARNPFRSCSTDLADGDFDRVITLGVLIMIGRMWE
jgi:hypothetical protein